MNSKQSLLVQPVGGELYDLEESYSCVCLEVPMPVSEEVQEVSSQTWYGEDGEDAYIPTTLPIKAFDWDIKCGIKATSVSSLNLYFDEMVTLLKGSGELKVYSSFVDRGRKGVYLKGVKDKEIFIDSNGMSAVTFTLSFRVTNPTTDVNPDDAENPENLQ